MFTRRLKGPGNAWWFVRPALAFAAVGGALMRFVPGIATALAVVLALALAMLGASHLSHAKQSRIGRTPFSNVQWDSMLSGIMIATALVALATGAAIWPASTGSVDGRAEVVVAVGSVSLVAWPFRFVAPRGWATSLTAAAAMILVGAFIAALAWVPAHPELVAAGLFIMTRVVITVAQRAGHARDDDWSEMEDVAEEASLKDSLRTVASWSIIILLILFGVFADWALRHPV